MTIFVVYWFGFLLFGLALEFFWWLFSIDARLHGWVKNRVVRPFARMTADIHEEDKQ